MKITYLRHATHIIEYNNKRILVDPVFSEVATMSAMPKAHTNLKNPLLPLPVAFDFVDSMDGVLVTHTHFDHFDQRAKDILPKDMPVFCSSHFVQKIKGAGFKKVVCVDEDQVILDDILIKTYGGNHGRGLVPKLLGKTNGFVLSDNRTYTSDKEPKIYIIGDSVWCHEVERALDENNPDVVIAYAGEAHLPLTGPITMSTKDIDMIAEMVPETDIVAIHMDVWSHCFLSKEGLKGFVENKSYKSRIHIPMEGDRLSF